MVRPISQASMSDTGWMPLFGGTGWIPTTNSQSRLKVIRISAYHTMWCAAFRSQAWGDYRDARHAARDVMFGALVRCMVDMKPINLLEADKRVFRTSVWITASRDISGADAFKLKIRYKREQEMAWPQKCHYPAIGPKRQE